MDAQDTLFWVEPESSLPHVSESLCQVCQVISFAFACDDDVIDIGEYVSANLVHEYRLCEAGESGPDIFEAIRHPHKTVGVEGGDETSVRLVLFT